MSPEDDPSGGARGGGRRRIAVIGAGVSGLTCAHLLDPHHDVTLFEADDRLGGHTNTVDVVDPTAGPLGVDTGFIVHNDRNYPNLLELFRRLDVPVKDSEMSFSVTDDASGFTYRATSPTTMLARPRNAVDPRLYRMLFDIARFYRAGRRHLASARAGEAPALTIGEFLDRGRYGSTFVELHLLPMGAAVWSTSRSDFRRFPVDTLLRFLDHHGLLGVGDRPTWRTVIGGSRAYVDAIVARFGGTIRTATPVRKVTRDRRPFGPGAAGLGAAGAAPIELGPGTADAAPSAERPGSQPGRGPVTVVTDDGPERFDAVILGCHSDQALRLLGDPSIEEREILGAIGYRPNRAVLHTDTSVLSPARRAWAAWNYRVGRDDGIETEPTLTYDMTTLQRLPGSERYLVTINPQVDAAGDPAVRNVLGDFRYAHPQFTVEAVRAQRRFDEIDGVAATHFCGAYWGYGFHEDGVNAALRVCRRFGAGWDPTVAGPGLER